MILFALLVAALVLPPAVFERGPATPAPEPERSARAAFEKFKALEGRWVGESTRGWKEEVSFKTIAQGSAVLQTSFDAHPGETMVTLISVNGDALDLTHYCVAGNQPHLRATGFEDGGREVTFTFVDAGNLPGRDKGHMDKAVFRFEDADRFSSRWTWYQDGQERWMEEIRLTRKKPLP
ncbi:MAG TPA: hypothetical protein VKG01_12175 [Thermoanaerobaculia bacterium]|nr:hypothetical protein [Thermoanaerobaculia bacterium]